jgi:hypothetical protein
MNNCHKMLSLAPRWLYPQAHFTNSANTGLAHLKRYANKIYALPCYAPLFAEFYPPLGKLIRTINGSLAEKFMN